MKLDFYPQPRTFHIEDGDVTITDFGKIVMEPNEMISFRTPAGRECDFTAKEWGFYPTSSLNSRMKSQGFKVALVRDQNDKIQINVVEQDKIECFYSYLSSHHVPPRIICWLDELAAKHLDAIENMSKR